MVEQECEVHQLEALAYRVDEYYNIWNRCKMCGKEIITKKGGNI